MTTPESKLPFSTLAECWERFERDCIPAEESPGNHRDTFYSGAKALMGLITADPRRLVRLNNELVAYLAGLDQEAATEETPDAD